MSYLCTSSGTDCRKPAAALSTRQFQRFLDQLIVEALMQVKGEAIAFSPGFRWETLPRQTITRGDLMEQTAITYPDISVVRMAGTEIKQHLEKLCDKNFNDGL